MRESGRKWTQSLFHRVVVVGALGALLAWAGAGAITSRAQAPPAAPQTLPSVPYHPARGDTIMVFAAHPDDETLGAGGFIHAASAAGARVTVVILTNGDGYTEGVDIGYHTLFSTPALFIRYGAARQQEALKAASWLGVPSSRVIFLGYPDRGLAVLWGSHWDCQHPYTSPFTRLNRSPYAITFRPESRYCGADVLADVTALLRRERPTVVVLHHPEDTHRDHWAAGAFVTFALESLTVDAEPWTRMTRVFHYIVHHGAWPTPRTYAPDLVLAPPPDLGLSHPGSWQAFSLSPSDVDAKRKAVLEYYSQSQLLHTYLLSFVRRNDLFGMYPVIRPSIVGANLSPGGPDVWDNLPSLIQTPAPGSILRTTKGTAVLDAVAVGRSPDQLLLALRLRRPAMGQDQYRIEMRLLYPGRPARRLVLRFRAPRGLAADRTRTEDMPLPVGAQAQSRGSRIDVTLPLRSLGGPASVYFHVVTIGPFRTVVDRTPWTIVRLTMSAPSSGGGRSPRRSQALPHLVRWVHLQRPGHYRDAGADYISEAGVESSIELRSMFSRSRAGQSISILLVSPQDQSQKSS